jgi:hypothetical protein
MNGIRELTYLATAFTGAAAILLFVAALSPDPAWLAAAGSRQSERRAARRLIRPLLNQSLLLGLLTVIGTIMLTFLTDFNLILAAILNFGLISLVAPLIHQSRERSRLKRGRREALTIAEVVVGQLNARATLPDALAVLVHDHQSGKRGLHLTIDALDTAVQALNVNQDLHAQLIWLAGHFRDAPELTGLWQNYAVMVHSSLGVKANIEHAQDVADSLRAMDELKNTLETELTTSAMTRMTMFVLIGGLILYLIFLGGSIGDVLANTLPGNILIAFAMFTLYVANLVGRHLEKLPILRF